MAPGAGGTAHRRRPSARTGLAWDQRPAEENGKHGVPGRRLARGGIGDARPRRNRLGARAGHPACSAFLQYLRRCGPDTRYSRRCARRTVSGRETFASRFGALMTLIGVAVGLGNVWRVPYMTGKFGGAAFVLFYVVVAVAIGVPALMAEFTLGRYTRRGT